MLAMKTISSNAVLELFNANARLEQRLTAGLSAVHGVALKEVLLLLHVQRAPGAKLSRVDLAKLLHSSPSTITRMTKPLEKIGLIDREADARDARLAYVVLTPAGGTLLKNATKTMEQMSDSFLRERYAEEEIVLLETLLGRISGRFVHNDVLGRGSN